MLAGKNNLFDDTWPASLIVDTVVGYGDRKKEVQSVYLTISDADLVRKFTDSRLIMGKQRFGDRNDQLYLPRLPSL